MCILNTVGKLVSNCLTSKMASHFLDDCRFAELGSSREWQRWTVRGLGPCTDPSFLTYNKELFGNL
jgi:hypothetical protein